DERLRPAATRARVEPDHRSVAYGSVLCTPAEAVIASGAGRTGFDSSLLAREHGVHDDAVTGLPRSGGGASLDDPADVLVAEREGEGAEGLEREAVVGGDGGEVGAADTGEGGLDADPVGAGECGRLDVVQRDTAGGSEREGR